MNNIKKHNKFALGSGCYDCRMCGLKTRETGDGESSATLCWACYEFAGLENESSDYGDKDGKMAARMQELRGMIAAKGGRAPD